MFQHHHHKQCALSQRPAPQDLRQNRHCQLLTILAFQPEWPYLCYAEYEEHNLLHIQWSSYYPPPTIMLYKSRFTARPLHFFMVIK
jgi:hypothetical protein